VMRGANLVCRAKGGAARGTTCGYSVIFVRCARGACRLHVDASVEPLPARRRTFGGATVPRIIAGCCHP
jgi:hypothetical protein